MWYQSDTNLVPIWFGCGTDLIPMWYGCGMDVVRMWYRSGSGFYFILPSMVMKMTQKPKLEEGGHCICLVTK